MQLWQVEHIFLHCIVLQVPFCEEKSVQLVRVAFFRSDFLQNPYFSSYTSNTQKLSILDIVGVHICESNSILPPARCDVPWALAAQIGSLFLSLPTFLLAICNYVEQPGYVRRVEGLDPWQNVATSNSHIAN